MPFDTAPEAAAVTPEPHKRLTVVQQLALSAYWLATNLHWGALLLIIVPKEAEVLAPRDSAGAIAAIFGYGAIIALIVPLIAGILSDRCMSRWGRRRPFMAFGVTVNVVGLCVMFYAAEQRSLLFYIVGYMIVQFGNNTAGAAYAGVIPDLVPVSQHGEASGYMATMTQAGTILGVVLSGTLERNGHFGLAYAVIAAVMVLFLLQTLINVRETPLATKPPPLTAKEFLLSLVVPLKSPDFRWVLITRGFVTLGMWCVQPFIQNYLRDVVHVPDYVKWASYLFALILAAATITGLLGGALSDKIGRKKVVYVANTLIAVCSVAFVFSHSLVYTFIVGALYGMGYGAYFSVDWALACDTLPNPEDAGKDMGIWHLSMVLPQTFAPALAGYVLGHIGRSEVIEGIRHYALQGYQAAFGLAAFFLLLGAILLRNVRDRHQREAEAQKIRATA